LQMPEQMHHDANCCNGNLENVKHNHKHVLANLYRTLCFTKKPGVHNRESRSLSKLFGQTNVRGSITMGNRAGHEGHHANEFSANQQGHSDERFEVGSAERSKVLLTSGK